MCSIPSADPVEALRTAVESPAALDVDALPATAVLELATELSGAMGRLTGVRLAALDAIARSGVWGVDGARSMPWALVAREDDAITSIRAELTLAERLADDLPLTADALRAGQVSLDKAKLLARIAPTSPKRREALRDPEFGEAFLLAKAMELDLWALNRAIRYWAYRLDPDADDQVHRNRAHLHHLDLHDTLDGTDVRGFLPHETGEALRTALRAATPVPPAGDRRTTGQRNAESIGVLARLVLDDGRLGEHHRVRPHLNVTVPFDTLLQGADEAGVNPATLTESATPIPRVVLDRLCCDAEITRIVFGPDYEVLDVGRTKRTVTPAQRRAVIARDNTCRGPGCHAPPRVCEVHHLIPWSRGGNTSVENSGLCSAGTTTTGSTPRTSPSPIKPGHGPSPTQPAVRPSVARTGSPPSHPATCCRCPRTPCPADMNVPGLSPGAPEVPFGALLGTPGLASRVRLGDPVQRRVRG